MADEAVVPDVAELTVCGLAVDMPVAGSAFPGGHNPRVGFFRAAQLLVVELLSAGGCTAPLPLVLACVEFADMVEVDDAADAIDELEFCRWTVFRAGVNISEPDPFIPPNPYERTAVMPAR